MIVAGGITTLRPLGGIHTNNPGMTQAQYDAQQASIEVKKAAQQARVDNLVDKLAQQHQAKLVLGRQRTAQTQIARPLVA